MNKNYIVLIIFIITMLTLISYPYYSSRNWEKTPQCLQWFQYEPFNCSSGILNECTNTKSEKNMWVQECLCQDNNLTGNYRVCPEFIETWRYNNE